MEQLQNEIAVPYLDKEINRLLAAIPEDTGGAVPEIRYNQNEELFILFNEDFIVPRLPVHHDIGDEEPETSYIVPVRDVVKRLVERIPGVFQGLSYYFDPTEISKLCFFRLYKIEDSVYLYFFRVDLAYHPLDAEIMEPGLNNVTAVYKSARLFVESTLIPLESVNWDNGHVTSFRVKQTVSNTYIGEGGREYFGYIGRYGIWKDAALTKFFSRLILPDGARTYPFYPLSCRYRTVCAEVPFLGPDFRRKALPILHRALAFLAPEMARIENSLKSGDFSDKMPLFTELRNRVPPSWKEIFQGYASKPYLNERDMKEFLLEVPDR